MNLKHLYYRFYQKLMVLLVKIVPYKKQKLFNHISELTTFIISNKARYFIVTDEGIVKAGLVKGIESILRNNKLEYQVYHKTVPNPTLQNVEDALSSYKNFNAQAIIAIGGGSPIDLAKALAARVARPNKSIAKMKGILKVNRKIPLLIAIPTTSGTGSEVTVASVVSDPVNKKKYAVIDPNLLPEAVLLDPKLTTGMPNFITATTGMDALTHAVECYLGNSGTSETERYSLEAIKLVFNNIQTVMKEPNNLEARKNMQLAAYKAGYAFTRAYVGNVHAIAHALGGYYNVVHGLANAIIMPYVLEKYGQPAHHKLAILANHVGVSNPALSDQDNAKLFIEAIKKLNLSLGIDNKIRNTIKKADLEELVTHSYKEANPFYPVPRIFTRQDYLDVYHQIGDLS
jgi:alcohol dehydrogenase class IV